MSDQDRQPEAREMQIPDGGLGSAMPAWLQQPPAWKRDPVQVPASSRTLPPPNDSEIDPRTLLDIDDLPRWLQDLARSRVESPIDDQGEANLAVSQSAKEVPETAVPLAIEPQHETAPQASGRPESILDVESTASPIANVEQVSQPVQETPAHASQPAMSAPGEARPMAPDPGRDSTKGSPPWWLSDKVLGLILLGIVVAMIYLVLAVSGVV